MENAKGSLHLRTSDGSLHWTSSKVLLSSPIVHHSERTRFTEKGKNSRYSHCFAASGVEDFGRKLLSLGSGAKLAPRRIRFPTTQGLLESLAGRRPGRRPTPLLLRTKTVLQLLVSDQLRCSWRAQTDRNAPGKREPQLPLGTPSPWRAHTD